MSVLGHVSEQSVERCTQIDSFSDERRGSAEQDKNAPVVISFYCGDHYYYEAAERLRGDCARVGLDYDIVELVKRSDENWIDICRRKVPFYLEMMRKHERPILWLDVDSRIAQYPRILHGATADIAGFLRGFRYLRGFDPFSVTRFFMPQALYFNTTPRARAFLEFMGKLERETRILATDDYFLQEAWERFDQQLAVMVLPPDLVGRSWPLAKDQVFHFGSSGNVSEYKEQAQQHVAELFSPVRRKAMLVHEAVNASKKKRMQEALFFYRKALEVDPSDDELAHKIARLMRRNGKLAQALVFLRRHQGDPFTHNFARRFLADSELEAGRLERAKAITSQLASRGTPSDQAWAQSRLVRIGLEERAAARKLSVKERPAIWWMENPYPGNFGDLLNPYVVEKLSGIPPRYVRRGAGILAIGSVIKFATDGTVVWGAGTSRMTDRLNANADYRAVRGPLTRQLVIKSGGTCPEVYGDPAWFLPVLYRPKSVHRRFKLGLVLHYANEGEVDADPDVRVISVKRAGYEGIEQFIDELCSCERILTTSLHGLIVSHAYGIPARWCQVTDSANPLPGDGTKFHDYLLSVGLEPEDPLPLLRGTCVTLDYVSEAERLPRQQIDLEALAAVAPFRVTVPLRRPW